MPTLVCVPILVHREAAGDAGGEAAALADAHAAKAAGADLVEFRLDGAFHGGGDMEGERLALRLAAGSPLPCIMTCRAASEGGIYDGDEDGRLALLERLAVADGAGGQPPRYIDLESAAYTRSGDIRKRIDAALGRQERGGLQTSLILSMHDFDGRPADLSRRVLTMQAEPAASVLKIAFRARSLRDNLELFDLLGRRDRPTIALGMGEFGLMSRVLAPKFGGFLTFASIRPTAATAPGQPTIDELKRLYRFDAIGPRTRVFGVIGWPVAHSLSPLVHNAGFDAIGYDGVYLPMPVAGADDTSSSSSRTTSGSGSFESFKATVLELLEHPGLDLTGCSVTLPHKQNLARLAGERGWAVDDDTLASGSANTLAVERDAAGGVTRVRATNTDGVALADSLADAIGPLEGARVAVIGAGGVARSAAAALVRRGASVTVFSRTRAKTDALVADLTRFSALLPAAPTTLAAAPLAAADLADLHAEPFDASINGTPVGMAGGPAPADSAIDLPKLDRPAAAPRTPPVVMDTVYAPILTPLLRQAAAMGYRTIDGVRMFARQAESQFEAWTGRRPPAGLFDRLVRERSARKDDRPPAKDHPA